MSPIGQFVQHANEAATSDPELERHFFLNRGKKGTKAGPKITYLRSGFANTTSHN